MTSATDINRNKMNKNRKNSDFYWVRSGEADDGRRMRGRRAAGYGICRKPDDWTRHLPTSLCRPFPQL